MHVASLYVALVVASVSSLTLAAENNNHPFHEGCAKQRRTADSPNRFTCRLDDQQDSMTWVDAVMCPSFMNYTDSSCNNTVRVRVVMPKKNNNAFITANIVTGKRWKKIKKKNKKKNNPCPATGPATNEQPNEVTASALEDCWVGNSIHVPVELFQKVGPLKKSTIKPMAIFSKSIAKSNPRPDNNDFEKEEPKIETTESINENDQCTLPFVIGFTVAQVGNRKRFPLTLSGKYYVSPRVSLKF